ncbi:MAG: hypothetical protein JNL62_15775 [Bryobacterales bacterium]|nr:hypothetical protein [Bryobacterales bacterium]
MLKDIAITGGSKQIVLEFPTLQDALQLWKPWAGGQKRREFTQMLHEALSGAGVSLEVRVQGKAVVKLGNGELSGLALALLG